MLKTRPAPRTAAERADAMPNRCTKPLRSAPVHRGCKLVDEHDGVVFLCGFFAGGNQKGDVGAVPLAAAERPVIACEKAAGEAREYSGEARRAAREYSGLDGRGPAILFRRRPVLVEGHQHRRAAAVRRR